MYLKAPLLFSIEALTKSFCQVKCQSFISILKKTKLFAFVHSSGLLCAAADERNTTRIKTQVSFLVDESGKLITHNTIKKFQVERSQVISYFIICSFSWSLPDAPRHHRNIVVPRIRRLSFHVSSAGTSCGIFPAL